MAWSVVALACLTYGQATPPASLSAAEFAALVTQLASPVYAEREAATQRLWAAAGSTQVELANVVKTSTDPEVRYRAAIILERFRRGIYADTPPASVPAIEMFNRDRRLRTEALRRLRDAGDWLTIGRLLDSPLVQGQQDLVDDISSELPGLIDNRLKNGDLPTAERLLGLAALRNPQAQRRLALMRVAAGTHAARMEQLTNLPEPSAPELRELATLYETAGNFVSARKLAQQLGDGAWERRLAESAGDWTLAAKLASEKLGNQQQESTAVVAALWRLAGNEPAYRASVEQILRDGGESATAWKAAKALFMLGETDPALALVKDHSPQLVFHILIAQQDYESAFGLVNTPRDATFDRAWLQLLPQGSNASFSNLTKQIRLASSIGEALHGLGEEESAHRIGDLLLEVMHEQLAAAYTVQAALPAPQPLRPPPRAARDADPFGYRGHLVDPIVGDDPFGEDPFPPDPASPFAEPLPPPRARPAPAARRENVSPELHNQMRLVLHMLRKTGRADEALRQAAWLIDRDWEPVDLLRMSLGEFPANIHLAELWAAAERTTDASTYQRVTSVARWLTPGAQGELWRAMLEAEEERGLLKLEAAAMLAADLPSAPLSTRSAAELCFLHGDEREGIRLLESDPHPSNAWRAAKIHFLRGRFDRAAAISERLATHSTDSGVFHYFQGLLQQRHGEAAAGRQSCAVGLVLVSQSDSASDELINMLVAIGLPDEACEVASQLERAAGGFKLHHHLPACNLLASSQPLASVRNLEAIRRALLGSENVVVTDDTEYVTFAYTAARVRARGLLAVGRVEEAQREIVAMRRILPREMRGLEQFIPALVRAEQTEVADQWFASILAAQQKIVATWPRAAEHHNVIAWTCARCQRELDAALRHALTAVELRPENAGYADTLAEVHFARGEVEKAVAAAQRAVQLAPRDQRLAKRLQEFEAAQRGEKHQRTFPEYVDKI
jgi:tetratricopeptide (TPR) repeat protein